MLHKKHITLAGKSQVELERTEGDSLAVSRYTAGGGVAIATPPVSLPAGREETKSQGGGGGIAPPLLDIWDISRRYAQEKKERRIKRFYQRYFTGIGVGGLLRFLTLTSSDEALARGIDIHRSFTKLVKRLRRRWGQFEYIGVIEVKGDRKHLHLVFRGQYMDQVQVSAMWADIHRSPVVDIRAMWGQRGGAMELAKYLAKEVRNRYWASYNWVFKGWVGWSKKVKRAVGHYPSRSIIRLLAKMGVSERLNAMWLLCPQALL